LVTPSLLFLIEKKHWKNRLSHSDDLKVEPEKELHGEAESKAITPLQGVKA
jgi:hypothetical protein